MLTDVLLLILSLALLAGGAEALVRGSNAIALRLGMTPMMAGLTMVAFGTSAPEMVVSLAATLNDQSAIAVGNVVGSNIFNILAILGVCATVQPINNPGIAMFDLWVMVAFAVATLPLMYTQLSLRRYEGVLLLAGYGAYLYVLWPV